VVDVLESGLVLQVLTHHGMLRRAVGCVRSSIADVLVIVIVHVLLSHEILWPLVLMDALGAVVLLGGVSATRIG
jgi:hypothetical protein